MSKKTNDNSSKDWAVTVGVECGENGQDPLVTVFNSTDPKDINLMITKYKKTPMRILPGVKKQKRKKHIGSIKQSQLKEDNATILKIIKGEDIDPK